MVGVPAGETEAGLPGGRDRKSKCPLRFSSYYTSLSHKNVCLLGPEKRKDMVLIPGSESSSEIAFLLKVRQLKEPQDLCINTDFWLDPVHLISLYPYSEEMSKCTLELQLTVDQQAFSSPCIAAKFQETQTSHSYRSRGLECLLGPSYLEVGNSLPPNAAHSN